MAVPQSAGGGNAIRIAVAGFGTVGQSVIRLLVEDLGRYEEELGLPLKLVALFDRSYQKKDLSLLGDGVKKTSELSEFLATPADVLVELLGGSEPADWIIRTGLRSGKAVVTANKSVMARWGSDYFDLAEEHHAFLGFEASVAGGIPIIRMLRRSLIADTVLRIEGILNGTCNFILSEMARSGREFEAVLNEAQERGYAEADPELDVSGHDTADKLAILTALAFRTWVAPGQIPARGIRGIWPIDFLYAEQLKSAIRLLGVAETHGPRLSLRVSPFLIDGRLPLSKITGALNAIEATGARLGSCVFSGPGAGGNPTAVSVVADILNAGLWKLGKTQFHGHRATVDFAGAGQGRQLRDVEVYPFYLRFVVRDEPGIIATLARILAGRNINIDSVVQEPWEDKSCLPFIITVEPTSYSSMGEALNEMNRLPFNQVEPLLLPILRP